MIAQTKREKTPIAVFSVSGAKQRCVMCSTDLISGCLYTRWYRNGHAFKMCTTCRPVEEKPAGEVSKNAENIDEIKSRLLKLPTLR